MHTPCVTEVNKPTDSLATPHNARPEVSVSTFRERMTVDTLSDRDKSKARHSKDKDKDTDRDREEVEAEGRN